MICSSCGKQIPPELLRLDKFKCPSCNKGYVRKRKQKKRSAISAFARKYWLFAIITIVLGFAVWLTVKLVNKPDTPDKPDTPTSTRPEWALMTESEATDIFDNLQITNSPDGVYVYGINRAEPKRVSVDVAREYIMDLLSGTVIFAPSGVQHSVSWSATEGFTVTIEFTLSAEELTDIASKTDAEIYEILSERIIAGIWSTLTQVVRVNADIAVETYLDGSKNDYAIRVLLPAGADISAKLGDGQNQPSVIRKTIAETGLSKNESAMALIASNSFLLLQETNSADGVYVYGVGHAEPKRVTPETACEYIAQLINTSAMLDSSPVSAEVEWYADAGMYVVISIRLPQQVIQEMLYDSDVNIYRAFAESYLAPIKEIIYSLIRQSASIAVDVYSEGADNHVLRVFLPAGVDINTELGDDPDHPCVLRSDISSTIPPPSDDDIAGEWRFTHAVTSDESTILYSTVINYIVVDDTLLTICGEKGYPIASFYYNSQGGVYEISGDAYVSAEVTSQAGEDVLVLTDIAGDKNFYSRVRE